MRFEKLVNCKVDLFEIAEGKRVLLLGYRLTPLMYRIELDQRYLWTATTPRFPPDRGVPQRGPTVVAMPLHDLDLVGVAKAAVAARRQRTALARVLVEDSTRGAYYRELHLKPKDKDTTFVGYRLRDPATNHTWLTFGYTHAGSRHIPIFDYSPPRTP